MWTPGAGEIVVILVVALLIFGPKKLPEIGKSIGGAVTEFKKGLSGKTDDEPAKPSVPKQSAPAAEEKKDVQSTDEHAG